jgi:hypothetical protein
MGRGVKVAPSLAQRRLQICNSCPRLIKSTRNCTKCLCFVDEKIWFSGEKCGIGKW